MTGQPPHQEPTRHRRRKARTSGAFAASAVAFFAAAVAAVKIDGQPLTATALAAAGVAMLFACVGAGS